VKEIADVYKVPGMLTAHEVDCLFLLGQIDHCDGVIVEIGSWKGKSTIALARGAATTQAGVNPYDSCGSTVITATNRRS